MVTKWGLSEKLGPLSYSEEEGEVFLGRSVTQTKHVSDDTAHEIDDEVRKIIDTNYERAETILKEKVSILHAMTAALMKYETIDQTQIAALMKGEVPPPPEDWTDDDTSSNLDGSDGGSAVEATDEKESKEKSKKDDGKDAIGDPASSH
jgi:cell division protease FtsH